MKRILVLVGLWASFLVIAGVSLAADPKKPVYQPQPATPPAPHPTGNSSRYVPLPGSGGTFYTTPRHTTRCTSSATAPIAQNSKMSPRDRSWLTPHVKTPEARIRNAPHQALKTLRA